MGFSYLHDHEPLLHGDDHGHGHGRVHHDVGSHDGRGHHDAIYFSLRLIYVLCIIQNKIIIIIITMHFYAFYLHNLYDSYQREKAKYEA